MGTLISRLVGAFREFTSGGEPSRVVMLGLDAAGIDNWVKKGVTWF